MKVPQALQANKKKILSTWIERTLDSYTSSGFFKSSKDRFANPVGANVQAGLTGLFESLVAGKDSDEYSESLDQVVRIRAVQEFTPAQAVAPILELKWVVRQVFSGNKETKDLLGDLDLFDCEVDRAALAAFDIYMECRERLYQTRIQELKSGSYILTDTPCSSKLLKRTKGKAGIG